MILFRHAQIYDGTGQKPFLGDVLVRNDRIAEVGQNLEVPEDTEILEANGATKLLGELFGEEIGMNVLPGNLPIEIEVIFELCE